MYGYVTKLMFQCSFIAVFVYGMFVIFDDVYSQKMKWLKTKENI